jgi:hypothetical protein
MVSSVDQVTLGIEIGYELRTITLTQSQWEEVQSGKELKEEIEDFYEGESFTYSWYFNDPSDKENSLVVTYNGEGVGYMGSVEDLILIEVGKDV